MLLDEIRKLDEKKLQLKKELYKNIYAQFERKIRRAVEMGQKSIVLRTPAFVVGYPPFNVEAATRYMQRQFTRGGFHVQVVTTADLVVSWDVRKKKTVKKVVDDDDTEYPSLMNLRKVANQWRNA
jgi:hypothetical protein